ncbi:MAG TPA: hypothetical protein ENH31_03360 [Nitrospirae bacterium]|nr:hypothetical protein BMS3Abin10_00205 [bacterium BMS3Abin10]GBE39837.1 hypothetical protein BMS3Bbin08_02469 [bacterium BMS3Bbin08]HDH51120.1 hypothetical protein [Nitrospirota bacterium]HDK41696.1 hypothetical protein [Nitrospirota bacterium]HDK81592.1 hypothetical protein [Nitrospirota bacterium]
MLLIENEPVIRLGFFSGVFAVMSVWELASPRRKLTTSKPVRWFSNLSITFLNSVFVRLIFPAAAVGTALLSAEQGWGLFHAVRVPELAAGLITIIFLDLIIYFQDLPGTACKRAY